MKTSNLSEFGKFIGLKVTKNPFDQTLEQVKEECKSQNLILRVWFPDTIGTMDYRNDRINCSIEENENKELVISYFYIS